METTFLVILTLLFTMITASSNVKCIERERQLLLVFRQGFTDQSKRLSTWTGVECCEWQGVVCDWGTGHVVELNLSSNGINSTIPVWLSNLTGLTHLNLYNNSFHGEIPDSIGSLSSLSSIDLSWNQLSGPIPPSLGGLSSLTVLYLYRNQLSGSIPESIGQLSNLQTLDLRSNQLSGVVSEIHFTKLNSLAFLILSGNSLTLNVSPHWIPPFQLAWFDASS